VLCRPRKQVVQQRARVVPLAILVEANGWISAAGAAERPNRLLPAVLGGHAAQGRRLSDHPSLVPSRPLDPAQSGDSRPWRPPSAARLVTVMTWDDPETCAGPRPASSTGGGGAGAVPNPASAPRASPTPPRLRRLPVLGAFARTDDTWSPSHRLLSRPEIPERRLAWDPRSNDGRRKGVNPTSCPGSRQRCMSAG
jgi:hypothetical protein